MMVATHAGARGLQADLLKGPEPIHLPPTAAPSVNTVVVRLAGDPQGKGRPRFVRQTGHTFTPAKTRSYEASLRLAAQDAMGEAVPMSGAVAVSIFAAFPVPGSWSGKKRRAALAGEFLPTVKPDADNLAKCCDALNAIVFVDDKQIVRLLVEKTYSEKPELRIEVSCIADRDA